MDGSTPREEGAEIPAESRDDQAEKGGNGESHGALFGWEFQDHFHHLQSFLHVVLWGVALVVRSTHRRLH